MAQFPSTNRYIQSGTTYVFSSTGKTLMVWAKCDNFSAYRTVFEAKPSYQSNILEVYQTSGQVWVTDVGGFDRIGSTWTISTGTWYCFAMTVEASPGSSAPIYGFGRGLSDTSWYKSGGSAWGNGGAYDCRVGYNLIWANEDWEGALVGFKHWNTVLSDDEIWNESMQLRPLRYSNLLTFLPMLTTSDATVNYGGSQAYSETGTGSLTDGDKPPIPWDTRPPTIVYFPVSAAPPAGDYEVTPAAMSAGADASALASLADLNASAGVAAAGADASAVAALADLSITPAAMVAAAQATAQVQLAALSASPGSADAVTEASGAVQDAAQNETPTSMDAATESTAAASLGVLNTSPGSADAATVATAAFSAAALQASPSSMNAAAVATAAAQLAALNTSPGSANAATVATAAAAFAVLQASVGSADAATVATAAAQIGALQESPTSMNAAAEMTVVWSGATVNVTPGAMSAATVATVTAQLAALSVSAGSADAATVATAAALLADLQASPASMNAATSASAEFFETIFIPAAMVAATTGVATASLAALSAQPGVSTAAGVSSASAIFAALQASMGSADAATAASAAASLSTMQVSPQIAAAAAILPAVTTLGTYQASVGSMNAAATATAAALLADLQASPGAASAATAASAAFGTAASTASPAASVAATAATAAAALADLSLSPASMNAATEATADFPGFFIPAVMEAAGVTTATWSAATLSTSVTAMVASAVASGQVQDIVQNVSPAVAEASAVASLQLGTLGALSVSPAVSSAVAVALASFYAASEFPAASSDAATEASASAQEVAQSLTPTVMSAVAVATAQYFSEFEFPVGSADAGGAASLLFGPVSQQETPSSMDASALASAEALFALLGVAPASMDAATSASATAQTQQPFLVGSMDAATEALAGVLFQTLYVSPAEMIAATFFEAGFFSEPSPGILTSRRYRASSPHALQRVRPKLPQATSTEVLEEVLQPGWAASSRTKFDWVNATYTQRSEVLRAAGIGDWILGVDDALNGGGIYKTNTLTGKSEYLAPISGDMSGVQYGPNGCAMGDDNWFYYGSWIVPRQIYRTNIVTHEIEKYGTTGENYFACGAWYNGNYYYTPTRSSTLLKVTFGSTTWTEDIIVTGDDVFGAAGFFFGDIAITKAGMLYGSAEYVGSSPKTFVFYSLDMNDIASGYTIIREYEQIPGGNDKWQLSIAGDSSQAGRWALYGISTAATREVYEIDPDNGVETRLSTMPGVYPTDISINDGANFPHDASWADANYALEDNPRDLPVAVQTAIGWRPTGHKRPRLGQADPDASSPVRPKSPGRVSPVDPTTNPVTEALPAKLPERRTRRPVDEL